MTTCTICVTVIEEDIAALPCRHVFHTYCINRWFSTKPCCPNCNKKMLPTSIIGPLYLENTSALKGDLQADSSDDRNKERDRPDLAVLHLQLSQLQQLNQSLERKVNYLKSLRSISEQDSRLQAPTALGRIRYWETLEKSDIVKLLAAATGLKEDSESKLRKANDELEKTKLRLTNIEDEKTFFEKKFNKLKDKLYTAQKSKFRANHHNTSRIHGEAGPSSARGSSSSSSSRVADAGTTKKDTVPPTVDSDESTDDEMHINSRAVPKKRTLPESSRRNHNGRIPLIANPSFSRSAAHPNLPTNSYTKHSDGLSTRDDARKRRRSETDESDVDDIMERDGSHDIDSARILNSEDDDDELNENDSLNDVELTMSNSREISLMQRARYRSPSPPVIEISDEE